MESYRDMDRRHRREDRRMWLLIAGVVLVLAGLIGAYIVTVENFTEQCAAAGGEVQAEYIGEVPIYDGKGQQTGSVPNYAYYCLDQDGEQIDGVQ